VVTEQQQPVGQVMARPVLVLPMIVLPMIVLRMIFFFADDPILSKLLGG
jgi:hypothetical protein